MGHGDMIAIVDGNYPAETDAKRLVRLDGHGAPRILDAILSVMPVDDMVPEAVWRPAAYLDPQAHGTGVRGLHVGAAEA